MKNKGRNIILLVVALLVISFSLYGILGKADSAANKIAIKDISLTAIDTGTAEWSNDGFDYNDSSSYTKVEGYTAGADSNNKNRLVRSFDKITYHLDFSIMGKEQGYDYEERKVDIKVTLPEDVAKYVTFDTNSAPGEASHTFTFNGIDTYGPFSNEVVLYVLGAPNGMEIKPKFEIQESTNKDSNHVIILGSTSFDSDVYNYEYDSEKSNKYSTVSNISGFSNYMPTIVSSKIGTITFNLYKQDEGQKAIYNDKTGRYLTYVLGVNLVGNSTTGVKGLTMPDGSDITFDMNFTQDGNTKILSTNSDWVRLYGTSNVNEIEPVVVTAPYSAEGVDSSKKAKFPGAININKVDDTIYNATISGYSLAYTPVKVNADGSAISNSNYTIGTYAISVFSERNKEDLKNNINALLDVYNINIKDTTGTKYSVSDRLATIVNEYYEVVDYSLTGEFYDMSGAKLSEDGNGKGSTSKGTELVYKTTFNYKKTLSDQGLKEVIKFDTNAFRVVSYGDSQVKITVEGAGDAKLTQDDFEVKFVTGDYNAANYSASNYNEATTNSKLSSAEVSQVQNACLTVSKNLANYSNDQIMNLYGGPCITANENVEVSFDKITDAKTEEALEIPITKVIVQTKDGVKLPDSAKIIVEVGVRVRNVTDITKTYQATAMASTSDYDTEIIYYAPRVTDNENSITNPNNYYKTSYAGTNITTIDTDSVWGDSVKIVNFTSRGEMTVTNKNKDGSTKINYNANGGETLNYNIKTIISDNNQNVGADDVWYINHLKVYVTIPSQLNYVPDKDLGTPEVITSGSNTVLVYTLPYTKPNMPIADINFKATISPKVTGRSVPITVSSKVEAININNEIDESYFKSITSSFTIYVTGINNVITTQKVGSSGSVVEKNAEFSYLLGAYNATGKAIEDYTILDILPSNGDRNGSKFNGSYKVKVTLPSSLGAAKVYCSTQKYTDIVDEVLNTKNEFKECNITEEYTSVTAIKITGISLAKNAYMEDILVSVKPEGNNYSDKYINSFKGDTTEDPENESNKIETRVVSRNISGKVFVDIDEDGVEETGDIYLQNMPVTLYKLDSDNNMTKVLDATTDKDGKYNFKNLDVGRYKIRVNYDNSQYDLTLRYGTEDTSIDSDAYKIEDGVAEISNKRIPSEADGIRVTREIESVKNMNVGLISRKEFGFDISKYITKIDLSYNNMLTTYDYNNESKVVLSVKNSLQATAKVYYGIKITNSSTKAGYVKLIDENIPAGMIFDANDSYNSEWFYTNGQLQSIALENDIIKPGETRYLKVALNMPRQQEARTFINTVTLLEIEEYQPEPLPEESTYDPNKYVIGEDVSYAGINWHVVSAYDDGTGAQVLTLLADSGTVGDMAHTSSSSSIYKWSDSLINTYINGSFTSKNTLSLSSLYDNKICDDASGLPVASYGGTLASAGTCQSNIYSTSKVRLLTEAEYETLKASNIEDLSWLNGDFWLMNSVYITQGHDPYGKITDLTNVKNLAKYVSDSSVKTGYNASSTSSWVRSTAKKEVRPVITISSRNIIAD